MEQGNLGYMELRQTANLAELPCLVHLRIEVITVMCKRSHLLLNQGIVYTYMYIFAYMYNLHVHILLFTL